MNWDLGWADYLTSQRDFIVARLVEENMEEVVFDEQQQLGKATVAKALGVLRLFSLHAHLPVFYHQNSGQGISPKLTQLALPPAFV